MNFYANCLLSFFSFLSEILILYKSPIISKNNLNASYKMFEILTVYNDKKVEILNNCTFISGLKTEKVFFDFGFEIKYRL